MRRFIKRPSPAMVVAAIALFMAMGGVGYAAATIGTKQIKNNSVRGKDIRNHTITGKDVKNDGLGGVSIKESSLGIVPSADSLSHNAVVSSGGQLTRGRGVSSVARTSTGKYQVIFNRDVRGCVYVASVGDTSAAGPPAGTAAVTSLGTNVNGVAIRTVDYNTNGDVLTNKPFHLIVSC